MSLLRTNVKPRKGMFPHSTAPPGYGPSDLQSAYSLPSSSAGAGGTVAVVDAYDDPNAEADLATYRAQYGLPACTTANGCFEKVNQEGQQGSYPSGNSGWAVEESLDVDMVSAVCPNCHIILVEANSASVSDLGASVDEAVKLGAQYVSNSYGATEQALGSSESQYDQYYNHPGVVITAAGGDSGYYGDGNGANFPAASQYVTSVGGTTLKRDSSVPRGWTESVWGSSSGGEGTGSGCSLYEAKPVWQTDPGCSNRMTNDVSAVGNPNTGVALYDSYGEGGWLVVGGTSVATPITASVYALAGTPAAGSYPSSYPYLNATGLNDVTSGANGSCQTAYFCTAVTGYDGPTGLGTPDGVAAFKAVSYGTLSGTVTDQSTGKPIAGATVTAGSFSGTTDSSGQYSFIAATGSYTVAVQAFGYAQQSASGVQVTAGQTATQNFALTASATVPVTGTITDGSGQGWPLFAKITIAGDPNGPVYTDPYTGAYSVNLPGQNSYTLTVTPVYPGYEAKTVTVTVGTSGVQQNAAVDVNTSACDAPGYAKSSGSCGPVAGGLIAGSVSDANTGKLVDGITVANTANSKQSGISAATGDPALSDGFYWLFASPPGPVSLTASGTGYQTATASATVTSGAVTHQDWTLKAGQLTISPASASASVTLGQAVTRKVTLTNNGAAPVQVSLGTQAGSFTPAGQQGVQASGTSTPLVKVKGHFTPGPGGAAALAAVKAAIPAHHGKDWADIASYPIPISANAAAYDPLTGKVYSVDGYSGGAPTDAGYVYNPSANQWSPIAPAPAALYEPTATFVDGTLYLTGGWTVQNGNWTPSAVAYVYTPGSNSWSPIASLPTAVAGAMSAVLGGQLYVVGGATYSCTSFCGNSTSDAVYRYDPSSNTWTALASYPVPVGFGACAGLDGQVVCTGGDNAANNDLSATYLYDPVANTWSQGADMPSIRGTGYWGMAYAGADGKLEIANGVTNGSTTITNEAQAYDPVTNNWSLLPNTNHGGYVGAGACGFYQIGGVLEGASAQVLAGYDQCDGAGDTPWLAVHGGTNVTVPAGQSVAVTVRLNSAKVSQPGTYTASLWAATDTPYPVQTVPVTFQVSPPSGWQEVSGTVTGHGSPLAGATVAFIRPGGPSSAAQAARTNGQGQYSWWLPAGQVQVSAAKDNYQPQARMIALKAGQPAMASFTLKPDAATSPSHPAGTHTAAAVSRKAPPSAAARKAAAALKKQDATARVCAAPKPGYAACLSLVRTGLARHKGLFPKDTAPAGYGPSDLQSAYSLPSGTAGQGETVAIVDAGDDPTAAADLATYRQQYGLPACTTASGCFTKVNQVGQQGNYPPNQGWGLEESLDIDMVSAVCPNCHILLVEANSASVSSLGKSVDEAVKLGARYVSNSYGTSGEAKQETSYNKYWDHPGVAVTASAGDSGYGVVFPAASPDVTSVGGTTLTRAPGTARGWAETAWGSASGGQGTGSGCSAYEPKPAWQRDTGCENRTVADVSAVADPSTGVAVYSSSYGGWVEVGGTSVASPVIASSYALAGTPIKGSIPASYPYLHSSGLNDVSSGANGTCSPAYLCTAGPGYDGPTGLGTPDGVAAFKPVTYGTLTGTVTSASGPVAGAAVTADGLTATTSSTGTYSLTVPPGSYQATVTRYGYAAKTATVTVTTGQTSTQNFTLAAAGKVTVSGTVTDGSGHGWPLYAKITIGGVPGVPAKAFYTSPYTGAYRLQLPGQNTYTLTVTPDYPGYADTTSAVTLATSGVRHDITVPVAELACLQAPGYTFSRIGGVYQDFTGWSGITAENGWTNVDNNGSSDWHFVAPGSGGFTNNPTGGSGTFAVASILVSPTHAAQDTSLVSPSFSLAGVTEPKITFDAYELDFNDPSFSMSVDLSLDGGTTWQNVWQQTTVPGVYQTDVAVSIPIPQAAGKTSVEVRFHYTGTRLSAWALDNIQVGTPSCAPVHGGLVAGVVSDANTGQPVNGVTVAAHGEAGGSGTSAATGDPGMPGGFYWLFSHHTGPTTFAATDPPYTKTTATASVLANAVTQQNWTLQAGQLVSDARNLSVTETLGRSGTVKVTFRNGGGAPVHVRFGAQDGGFTPLTQVPGRAGGAAGTAAAARRPAAGSSWSGISAYPDPAGILNNAVATDPQTGQVYSVGGQTGSGLPGQATGHCPGYGHTAEAYVYNPVGNAWKPIAPLPQPLENPAAAFLDGTLYVVGGFNCDDAPSAAVYAYTPGARTWVQVASLPSGAVAPGIAVLDGQLYVVAGCTYWACSGSASQAVYRYTPATSHWTKLASYPVYGGVSFGACAGIDGEIVCAGGLGRGINNVLNATYIYDPVSNTWTQGADMPYRDYQMAYSGANGQLQVAGGISADLTSGGNDQPTSQVSQYNPASNTWSSLPSLPSPEWGGGGACGMYVIGGVGSSSGSATTTAQVLSGYDQCDGAGDTGWLPTPRGFTLQAGQSLTVAVQVDAAKVSQPGTYTADLYAATNTPYANTVIPVTLTVKPPAGWGLLSGTVTTARGKPVAGATVQVGTTCTAADYCGKQSYTLTAGADGSWQWWLPTSDNDLLVIAAKDGYIQQVTHARVRPGQSTDLTYHLRNYQPPPQ